MKVPPPERESMPYDNNEIAEKIPLLKGSLDAFNGTPAESVIRGALEEAGYNPATYDAEEAGHCHYYGFPTTGPTGYEREDYEISPIIYAVAEKIEKGEIEEERASLQTHSINYESANGKNVLRDLYAFRSVLMDPETGEPLAFLADISTHGGRTGEALLSPKDVVERSEWSS